MNRRRKDTKETFAPFGLYLCRKVYKKRTEYGNVLFSYFVIFYVRFGQFYFGFKDYRVFVVSLINFGLVKFREIEKKNISSNP